MPNQGHWVHDSMPSILIKAAPRKENQGTPLSSTRHPRLSDRDTTTENPARPRLSLSNFAPSVVCYIWGKRFQKKKATCIHLSIRLHRLGRLSRFSRGSNFLTATYLSSALARETSAREARVLGSCGGWHVRFSKPRGSRSSTSTQTPNDTTTRASMRSYPHV